MYDLEDINVNVCVAVSLLSYVSDFIEDISQEENKDDLCYKVTSQSKRIIDTLYAIESTLNNSIKETDLLIEEQIKKANTNQATKL